LEIPQHTEWKIRGAVTRHLKAELGSRGLLLPPDRLQASASESARLGASLLRSAVHQCYPIETRSAEPVVVEFRHERDAARVTAALAFGAATAALFAPCQHDSGRRARSVELLCAIFNLGIGLVDGLCDEDPEAGGQLLELIGGHDLVEAAEEAPGHGWLRARLPPRLAADPAVAFTADLVEAFFRMLHAVHLGDRQLRCRVGAQLAAALAAERQSVGRSSSSPRDQLIECSRGTSVLPFQIIETLVGGDAEPAEPSVGTLLGEATWRIDDLVDLCQDARRGALNGILLAVAEEREPAAGPHDPLVLLERLLRSTHIASAAAEAAERLRTALRLVAGERASTEDHASFLHFIQGYAGITPGERS